MHQAQATLQLAAVRIGATQVGVPVEAILVAVPASALALLPRRGGALCGVVEHDERLVPVVDLARWVDVGLPSSSEGGVARLLLLRDGARRIGLRVDAVRGLTEVAAGDLMRLHHDDDPEEIFHSAVRARQLEAILSVLDVGRLITLSAAWQQDDEAGATIEHHAEPASATLAGEANAATAGQVNSEAVYGLLLMGDIRVGVPIGDLAQVLPMPELQSPGVVLPTCLWRDRHVPVAPAAVFGAKASGAGAGAALVAIINHNDLAIGLPVDSVLSLDTFTPGSGTAPCALGVTCYDSDGNAVLLIDSAALLARYPEVALSRVPTKRDHEGTMGGVDNPARSNQSAYIVFEADGLAAAPIGSIDEVLPFDVPSCVQAMPTTMEWRGAAIGLVDIRVESRQGQSSQRAHVLVVRRGDIHVACIATAVHLLIPPGEGLLFRMGQGAQSREFITVGEGESQTSFRTVDLTISN